MSPVRLGRAKAPVVSSEELHDRTSALAEALAAGGDELDPAAVAAARRVVDKARERLTIAGDHTVVALAGATGSGKSSLFNALVGEQVATIGARRPTTSKATAAVWGGNDAGPLLDWLQVDARHLVGPVPEEAAEDSVDGLVLLDLPDFDSRVTAHRQEAERILELVDVFVWVTDPQKYADARLHDEFVRALSVHEAVTLAVLNQADRLTPEGAEACAADLARLLAVDGVSHADVLTTSVRTGAGVPALEQRLASAVAGHAASRTRLAADVVTIARRLRGDVADREARPDALPRRDLDAALSRAAGVPIVLDAVARDYRREAAASTGWLFTRWTRRFGADPLRRLRLERGSRRAALPLELSGADVRAVLGRSSIPAPSAAIASAVDVATRGFLRDASADLPLRWSQAVESAAAAGGDLSDALDQAVVATPLRARRPAWWLVANLMQWVLGLAAVAGLVWLGVLYAVGLLALPRPDTPTLGIVPVPTLLLGGGVLLGLVLSALARWWARLGSRRRRRVIGKRLERSISQVTDTHIVAPVAHVLGRHRTTRERLDAAAR
ncbi:MAG TPA: GTPase [Intrasporangium sp.]|uniref:GTPase n=1 Tax=Intrasporangium sp. TaxID=1925024 RepID=UPI002D790EC4|nr:GTPase [Intrasporangium sp.]HET7399023.1 GTPase [Intrasporangium sp.]